MILGMLPCDVMSRVILVLFVVDAAAPDSFGTYVPKYTAFVVLLAHLGRCL